MSIKLIMAFFFTKMKGNGKIMRRKTVFFAFLSGMQRKCQ
jgi:hypothetical protein